MLDWVYSFVVVYFDYLTAPILFHTSCDGYVMAFLFTIMELNDTFAGYRIYFGFIFAGLLLRNYIFSVFKQTTTLLGRGLTPSMRNPGSTPIVSNHLKTLGGQFWNVMKPRVSNLMKVLKARFFN